MIATSAKKSPNTELFVKTSYSLQIHIPFSLYSIFGEKKTKYNFSFAIPLCIPPTAPRLLFYRGNKSANYSRPRDSLLPSCPPAIKRRPVSSPVFFFFCVPREEFREIRANSRFLEPRKVKSNWKRRGEGGGGELFRSWEILSLRVLFRRRIRMNFGGILRMALPWSENKKI